MVSLRRIAAETRRELGRPTGPWTLVAFLAAAGLFTLFALAETGPGSYTAATYLFVPLLWCPLAAQRVASDRERGMRAVQATTPLRPGEILVAELGALTILLVAGLALTLPLLYTLTDTIAPGAFAASLPLVAWGLALGGVATAVGLLVGYARRGPATGALSVAFGVVVAWTFLAVQRHRFLGWAQTDTQRALVEAVLHASPLTWAHEAEHPVTVGVLPDHGQLLGGLAALTLALLLVLAAVALALVHVEGWVEHVAQHPIALAAVALGLLGAGATLAGAPSPEPPTGHDTPSEASRTQVGPLHLALDADAEGPWQATTPVTVEVTIRGPPGANVSLDELVLSGPSLAVAHDLATPTTVALDEVRKGRGAFAPENGTYGVGHVQLDATATPRSIADLFALQAQIVVDGNATTLALDVPAFEWRLPATGPLIAAATPLGLTGLAAFALPRRMNRW